MNQKFSSLVLAAILIFSVLIPNVYAPIIDVYPLDSDDDAFITGIGAYFGDTPFIFLKEITQDIIIGNRFRNVTIPQGSKINNATLFVRSIYDYDPAGNLSVTIYGDAADDSESFNESGSFTRTYTGSNVVWNISEVNGNQWNNISVTAIVQEIIDRIGWTSGNSLSFIMLSATGSPRREYVSVDGNPAFVARLNIAYAEEPTTPAAGADPPYNDTDVWTWEYNETYRGIDIWEVTNPNRTGEGGANGLNWNRINMTELTEIDSGAALLLNNDTWLTITNLQAQQWDSLYNDTGAASTIWFFLRFGINVTAVTNNLGAGSDRVASLGGMSTATPVGGGGLAAGGNGNWAGLIMQLNADDIRWNMRLLHRAGAATTLSPTSSPWRSEALNEIIYGEFILRDSAVQSWMQIILYTDAELTNAFFKDTWLIPNSGPYRYAQVLSSLAFGTSRLTGEYHTFLNTLDYNDTATFLVYPNGTLVTPDPIPEDADPEDVIDELLGGAQPEDPQTDEYGDALTKFRWKLLWLAVGMIMLVGSPIAGIFYGADTANWIKIAFVMFFGLGLLWQLSFM